MLLIYGRREHKNQNQTLQARPLTTRSSLSFPELCHRPQVVGESFCVALTARSVETSSRIPRTRILAVRRELEDVL
jgi:hypothetical protein